MRSTSVFYGNCSQGRNSFWSVEVWSLCINCRRNTKYYSNWAAHSYSRLYFFMVSSMKCVYWIWGSFSTWCCITSAKQIVHSEICCYWCPERCLSMLRLCFSHERKKYWRTSEIMYLRKFISTATPILWLREKCQIDGRILCLTAETGLARSAVHSHCKQTRAESGPPPPVELKSSSETRLIWLYASSYDVSRTFKFILDTLSHFNEDRISSDRRIETKSLLTRLSADFCGLFVLFLNN